MQFEWNGQKNMKKTTSSNISKTDWERVKTMSDDEIDLSDIGPMDELFFAEAELRRVVPEVVPDLK